MSETQYLQNLRIHLLGAFGEVDVETAVDSLAEARALPADWRETCRLEANGEALQAGGPALAEMTTVYVLFRAPGGPPGTWGADPSDRRIHTRCDVVAR